MLSTTRMSSKGQVVIPEEIRLRLHLEAGMQFVVVAEGDVVILKTIKTPDLKSAAPLVKKARQYAKKVGMSKADLADAIEKARKQ